jgi:hypothetical protein
MNSKLFVGGDVSLNSKLFVGANSIMGGDVSMNSKLFVGGDVSLNSKLFVGGDVGIGTTTPSYKLDIKGNSGTLLRLQNNTAVYNASEANIEFWTDTYNNPLGMIKTKDTGVGPSGAYQSKMEFYINSGSTSIAGTTPAIPLKLALTLNPGSVVFENNLYMKNNYTLYAKNSSGTADDAVFLPRGSDNATYLNFGDNGFYIRNNTNTPTMFMNANGNVGIGTIVPRSKLDVTGGVIIGASYAGVQNGFVNGLLVEGAIGVGTGDVGTYKLNVNGNVQAVSYNATSDVRLKTNIQPLTDSLELVNQLNGVSFTWKNDTTNKPVLGLIAQDVEKVLPDIVNTATADNELGYKQKSIHYDGLFPHLIESIKTLTQENKALVSKVDVLTQENKDLSAKVDHIMSILNKLNISV